MKLLEELKWRGLVNDITDPALEQLLENEKITFYVGADPTADSLHVGHLISYLVSKRLQDRGHHPILVIGGGTGLIGDPSGRSSERNLLTLETTLANGEAIKKQVLNIIDDATVVNNYDWIKEFDIITFLRDIGKHFSIAQMIAKDSVKSRMENGISFTEFTYQIIQSLDFMHLFETSNCKLQIGGADQWGNITAGLELIRKTQGHEAKAYGLTWPLLTKSDGTKFGKTAGGAVWLDPKRTTPYEFFQYWINAADKDAVDLLKKFTFKSIEETQAIIDEFLAAPHTRLAQKAVAEELTILVHGQEAYDSALRISNALFKGDIQSLSMSEIADGFKDVPSIELKENKPLIDVLIDAGLAQSRRQSREFIQNNAVSVNGEKVKDLEFVIKKENAIEETFTVLRRGKKKYALIKH